MTETGISDEMVEAAWRAAWPEADVEEMREEGGYWLRTIRLMLAAADALRPDPACDRLHFDRDIATDALCSHGTLYDQARTYTETIGDALREREPLAVRVERSMSAEDANGIHGDRYGVDWEYMPDSDAEAVAVYQDCIARGLSDAEARGTAWPDALRPDPRPPSPERVEEPRG